MCSWNRSTRIDLCRMRCFIHVLTAAICELQLLATLKRLCDVQTRLACRAATYSSPFSRSNWPCCSKKHGFLDVLWHQKNEYQWLPVLGKKNRKDAKKRQIWKTSCLRHAFIFFIRIHFGFHVPSALLRSSGNLLISKDYFMTHTHIISSHIYSTNMY